MSGKDETNNTRRVLSYILMHDTGFAPCIKIDPSTNKELWSLVCCKPRIRSSAKAGEYVVGIYGVTTGGKYTYAIAYVARISEKISMKEYYNRYHKPYGYPGRMDCIYDNKLTQLANDFHNKNHIRGDLSGGYALLSNDFVFLGTQNVRIPKKYLEMIAGRGHRVNRFSDFDMFFDQLKKQYGHGKVGKNIHHHSGATNYQKLMKKMEKLKKDRKRKLTSANKNAKVMKN